MRREFHVRFSEGGGVQLLSATRLIDRRERVVCVREDHTGTGEAITTLVGVSLSGATAPQVLVSGNDFYSTPRDLQQSVRARCAGHHRSPERRR